MTEDTPSFPDAPLPLAVDTHMKEADSITNGEIKVESHANGGTEEKQAVSPRRSPRPKSPSADVKMESVSPKKPRKKSIAISDDEEDDDDDNDNDANGTNNNGKDAMQDVKMEEAKTSPYRRRAAAAKPPIVDDSDDKEDDDDQDEDEDDDFGEDSDDEGPSRKKKAPAKGRSKASSLSRENISDDDDDDDDIPLSARVQNNSTAKSAPAENKAKPAKKVVESDSEDDEDDDVPLTARVKKEAPKKKQPAKRREKRNASAENSEDSEDDVPLSVRAKKVKKEPATKTNKRKKAEIEDTPEKDGKKVKKETKSPRKKKVEEEEDVFKWWEQEAREDGTKWSTLEHQGVYFPPEYVPHGVKMKYEGKEITLSPPSEEVAGFFAALLGTQYVENPTFCKNFFNDFLKVLEENDPDCPIEEFEKCDFTPMHEHFERQREIRKNMSKEEKEVLKEEKKKIDDHYGYAIIDGRREKLGNFRIEPPGLFRGRGDHPKTGTLKKRVYPEQITINIGAGAKVPDPPVGHTWGSIVHDNTVAWLATWTENVNNNVKYVMFGAGSSLKGMSDFKKFEKARELKSHIATIRTNYMRDLKDKLMETRQRATALWLIDKLALRAGNEKGEDEADTVGCCSLRYEHVELEEDEEDVPDPKNPGQTIRVSKKMVVFDFLGKDSIRYYNRVEVDPVVWKNLKIFKKDPKKESDPIFDRLSTSSLNKHLQSLMPGLTAKVFRTYNASYTFQEELKKTPEGVNVAELVLAYNRANRQVAILCNHQRSVSKAHGQQMEKLSEKLLTIKYQRYLVKKKLLKMNPKLKKDPKVAEPESDMDDETIARKEEERISTEKEKHEKKYERALAKAEAEGKEKPKKTKFIDPNSKEVPEDRLLKQLETLNNRVVQTRTLQTDRDENKTTSLGTSKTNYIDPRLTAAWCKRYDVPIEKMFNKSLRDKFKWAMDVDEDWQF